MGKGGQKVAAAVAEGARIAEAQNLARDLVNTPGGTSPRPRWPRSAVEIAERENLEVTVLGPAEIAERPASGASSA